MLSLPRLLSCLCVALAVSADAAITFSGIADKTKYSNTVTFTVTADPGAATTTATVDGVPVAVGSPVTVTAVSYHELKAESRDAGNVIVDSQTRRFIVHASVREGSEDGIPPHTPYRSVPDAPSAFVGKTLKVSAPAAWPVGMPVPVAVMLRDGANENVRLNGVVKFGGFPQATAFMRRGWGSVQVPAATAAGTIDFAASVNSLVTSRAITFEAAPVFTTVSGTIAGNTAWPANSRIHVTGTLTVNAGVTLTVGAGTIVKIYTGTATNGTAAEIKVNGTLQVNGTEANPVVFCPDTPGQRWGGIELLAATSVVNAQHAFFTGSGEDETWTANNSGVAGASHQGEQMLFLVVGSGSGTNYGAQLSLTNCYCIDNQQIMNSKTNVRIDLTRTLYQRAITSGELSGCKLTIDRCALIEFPSETSNFVNDDNDAIYLTNGELSITNTVIGFTKDDGVDSGGDGGDNPFTAATDITHFLSQNNWYEGTTHEGNSLSGTREVNFIGCVFLNCGQGVEAGYSTGTLNGPNATVDGCLFVSNIVGVRWGDNYGPGYTYNPTHEVKNSFVLNSLYKDCFSGNWHGSAANAWIYQTSALNTFGRQYFNVHGSYLSQPDPAHHPANTSWNPAAHGALLAPFMPVPGSNVGVAISSYAAAQSDTSAYPGTFTVRLSTFSSNAVSVDYFVIGKTDPLGSAETLLAGGMLNFAAGETLRTISPAVASPGSYGLIRVALGNPVNAEVTGEAWYFKVPVAANPNLVALGSAGWRYRETRNEPPATWTTLAFDDSSPAATEWLAATLPAGYGATVVTTVVTTVVSGSGTDRTKAFYFRKKFTVADPAEITALTFRVRRDDAVVVWLNNEASATLVSADGTFNPPYSYDATTIAAGNVPNSTNTANYLTYSIPVAKVVAGENILAIQLHQTSLTSGDILLDCELLATYDTPLQLAIGEVGGQPVLYWFDPAAILEATTDFTLWTPLPAGSSPFPYDTAIPKEFFRLRK